MILKTVGFIILRIFLKLKIEKEKPEEKEKLRG